VVLYTSAVIKNGDEIAGVKLERGDKNAFVKSEELREMGVNEIVKKPGTTELPLILKKYIQS